MGRRGRDSIDRAYLSGWVKFLRGGGKGEEGKGRRRGKGRRERGGGRGEEGKGRRRERGKGEVSNHINQWWLL